MPGYIKKQLVKYKHVMQRIQHCPYLHEPKKYGADAQSPLPTDETRKLTDAEIKEVQKIVRSILYYARAVDLTVLMVLSTIVSEKTKGTKKKNWKRRTTSLVIWCHTQMQRSNFVHRAPWS
jgi:hypothetical protein